MGSRSRHLCARSRHDRHCFHRSSYSNAALMWLSQNYGCDTARYLFNWLAEFCSPECGICSAAPLFVSRSNQSSEIAPSARDGRGCRRLPPQAEGRRTQVQMHLHTGPRSLGENLLGIAYQGWSNWKQLDGEGLLRSLPAFGSPLLDSHRPLPWRLSPLYNCRFPSKASRLHKM